ncbi:hypothetical protein ACFX13_004778 [Malus domestica]
MALSAAFREGLEHMERTRNQRLSLLRDRSPRREISIRFTSVEDLRVLKSEVEELEELEKEKKSFYELKGFEMKEFKQNVVRFALECQMQVQILKNGIDEVKL